MRLLLLILFSFSLSATETNLIAFGSKTLLDSDISEVMTDEYWELGLAGSIRKGQHSVAGAVSTKLIEDNRMRFDYLFYQYDFKESGWSTKIGQLNNTLGFISEGIFNPHVRYTVLPSQVSYWTSVRGMGASATGVMAQFNGCTSKGSAYSVQLSYGEPVMNVEHQLTHDVMPRALPYKGTTEFGKQLFLSARWESVHHSFKYSTSFLPFKNEFADNKYLWQNTLGYKYEDYDYEAVIEFYYLKADIFMGSDYGFPPEFDWYQGNSHGFTFHGDYFVKDDISVYAGLDLLYLNSQDPYGSKGGLQNIARATGAYVDPSVTYTKAQRIGIRYDISHNFRLQLEYQKTWGNYSNNSFYDVNNDTQAALGTLHGDSWDIVSLSFVFTTF